MSQAHLGRFIFVAPGENRGSRFTDLRLDSVRSIGGASGGSCFDHTDWPGQVRRPTLAAICRWKRHGPAQDEAAVDRVAHRGNRGRRELISEQTLVAPASRVVILAQFKIEGVCRDHRIRDAERLAAVARPGVAFRGRRPARPNRVELDVALAGDEVAVSFDQRLTEAALEECPGAAVSTVNVLHVALPETFHEPGRSAVSRWRRQ